MIFKFHYWAVSAGLCAIGILIGVFMEHYTGASSLENGIVFMMMPFCGIVGRPIICSMADRARAHRKYIMSCQTIVALSYMPFVVIPYLGPQVYRAHSTICWWILVVCKIIGDVAFGGMKSVADSVAINYANRINVPYGAYRIWGAISWMVFGFIIGLINEISFMPKYVPGFLVLIGFSLADVLLIWLWPPEYFDIVPIDHSKKADNQKEADEPHSQAGNLTKALLPKEVVWRHAKSKLIGLVCIGRKKQPKEARQEAFGATPGPQEPPAGERGHQDGLASTEVAETRQSSDTASISLRSQMVALSLLIRKDVRIVLYSLVFMLTGMSMIASYFLVLDFSELCHNQGRCHFSQLIGMTQVTVGLAEMFVFIYIARLERLMGRLNICGLSFALSAIEYGFYGTLLADVSPYYVPVFKILGGSVFGIYITVVVELAHELSNEVEFVLPELWARGLVKSEAEAEKMKTSLSATMQALMSLSQDGFGRALGALLMGYLLEYMTYRVLWVWVSISCVAIVIVILACSVIVKGCNLAVGLDEKVAKEKQKADTNSEA